MNIFHKTFSRVGFGGWQLGNTEFWGAMTEQQGIVLVEHAFQKGIRLFDTAPGYANGKSEIILGKALKSHRNEVVISSKFGHTADGKTNFDPDFILHSTLESLARLQTDHLDCLLLHNPSNEILLGQTKHFQVLRDLQTAGFISNYGVSIDTLQELNLTLQHTDSQVIEILFNLFFQDPISLFPEIERRNIFLIAKVPLDSGWLSGKYNQSSKFTGIRNRWSLDTIQQRAKLVEQVKKICKDEKITKYALAFILSFPAIGAVIPGMKSIENIDDNLAAAGFKLDPLIRAQLINLYKNEISNHPLIW